MKILKKLWEDILGCRHKFEMVNSWVEPSGTYISYIWRCNECGEFFEEKKWIK